jgi:hypothetical protein
MAEAKTYAGGCQCGAVRFEVETALEPLIECNCSRCRRIGSILTFVPAAAFRLEAGEGQTTQFQFNHHRIHHRFCQTCGVQSFAEGKGPDGSDMVAINVRCLEGVDPWTLETQKYDGASH